MERRDVLAREVRDGLRRTAARAPPALGAPVLRVRVLAPGLAIRVGPALRAVRALVAVLDGCAVRIALDVPVLPADLDGVMALERDGDLRCSCPLELGVAALLVEIRVVVRAVEFRTAVARRALVVVLLARVPDCTAGWLCGEPTRAADVALLRSGWERGLG